MTRFLTAMGLMSALVLASGLAGADDKAQDGKKKGGFGADPAARFKKADANNDGKVSKEEFKKSFEQAGPGKFGDKGGQFAEKMFERLDANKDGSISQEEFKKMAAGFGGFGGGKGGFDPKKLEELKKKFGDGKFDPKKLEELKNKFGGKGGFDPKKLEELKKKIGDGNFDPEKLKELFKKKKDGVE